MELKWIEVSFWISKVEPKQYVRWAHLAGLEDDLAEFQTDLAVVNRRGNQGYTNASAFIV